MFIIKSLVGAGHEEELDKLSRDRLQNIIVRMMVYKTIKARKSRNTSQIPFHFTHTSPRSMELPKLRSPAFRSCPVFVYVENASASQDINFISLFVLDGKAARKAERFDVS